MLPRNRSSQLNHLGFTQMFPQPGCQFGRNIGWSLCHRDRKMQHHPLEIAEGVTGLVLRKHKKLIFCYAGFSADGRADVKSERATDKRACLDLRQRLQPGIDALTGKQCHLETLTPISNAGQCRSSSIASSGRFLRRIHPHQCHRSSTKYP